jgi:hypothetical protein
MNEMVRDLRKVQGNLPGQDLTINYRFCLISQIEKDIDQDRQGMKMAVTERRNEKVVFDRVEFQCREQLPLLKYSFCFFLNYF